MSFHQEKQLIISVQQKVINRFYASQRAELFSSSVGRQKITFLIETCLI